MHQLATHIARVCIADTIIQVYAFYERDFDCVGFPKLLENDLLTLVARIQHCMFTSASTVINSEELLQKHVNKLHIFLKD